MNNKELLVKFYRYMQNTNLPVLTETELYNSIDVFLNTNNKFITIYTDGSCTGNGKKNSKGGIGVFFNNDDPRNISLKYTDFKMEWISKYNEDLGEATNNKCELGAIYKALRIVKQNLQNNERVIIKSDSKYSINCCTTWIKKWEKDNWLTSTGKKVSNKNLIIQIHKYLCKYKDLISLEHVRGHQEQPSKFSDNYDDWYGNDMADKLATHY